MRDLTRTTSLIDLSKISIVGGPMSAPPSPKRVKTLFATAGLVWPMRAVPSPVETYGFYESHFMNESRVEDITETIVEVSYNLKCQYGFWQSVKLRDSFLNK